MVKNDLKMIPSSTPKTPPQNIPKNSSPHPRNAAEPSRTQPSKTMYLSNNGISTAISIYLYIYISIELFRRRPNPINLNES